MTGRPRAPLVVAAMAAVTLSAVPAVAQWLEIYRADASLDLRAARELAAEAVAADPSSVDAVAAAGWWLENLSMLPEAGEIAELLADRPRDPELGFLLAQIEARLELGPPQGSLETVELAGPFGVFETVDLERGVVPPDHLLPPLETPWRGPGSAFRLRIRSAIGAAAPSEPLTGPGVYLAAWTVVVDERLDGWLVLEVGGSANLELDGTMVARLRQCGELDPAVSWYRVELAPGRHRIRVEMAAPGGPQARVSLIDDRGRPAVVRLDVASDGPWAGSMFEPALPPAAAELDRTVGAAQGPGDLLMAAFLAGVRGDPIAQGAWLERAQERAPDDPWVALAQASYQLAGATGADPDTELHEAADHLRRCSELPAAGLAARAVAIAERREEDAGRVLGELVSEHRRDPRVLQLWIQEAVSSGWVREAEQALAELAAMLPESRGVIDLRLATLGALDRHDERRRLLRVASEGAAVAPEIADELAAGCLVDEAVVTLERLRERFDDPRFDIMLARLHLDRGERGPAQAALDRARSRWGDLRPLDRLAVAVAAGRPERLEAALDDALRRDPANLELRTVAWRQGAVPFFEPFRVEVDEVTARQPTSGDDSDVELLLDQAVERVFADGSSLYYYHGISRAATPVGARQAARLQPMPDPHWLRIRVIKPDGTIVVPASLGVRDGVLDLEDVKPGDLVEEEYVAPVASGAAFPGGHLSPYVYRFADPVRAFGLSEYVLVVPPGIELNVAGNHSGLERRQWEEEGLTVIRWRAERMPPVPPEPFSPPNQDLLPWVSYGFGVTWQNVGDAIRNRVLPLLATTAELAEWGTVQMASSDPVGAVRDLVVAVCDEVDPGRSPLSLTDTAGESFSRRAGSRLAIVASVLAESGWEVDLVLARASPFAHANLEVPTLDAFSEPLLRARIGDRELWIDLEEQRRGVDHIRPILQGGDALVLPLTRPAEPVTLLERLPGFANPELEQRVAVSAVVDVAGDAAVVFEMALRGSEAERMRQRIEGVPDEKVQQAYQQMAANLFPGATRVRGSLISQPEGATTRLEMELPGACEVTGDGLLCRSLVVPQPLVPMMASLPERRFPLVLQLPLLRRNELTITPPEGWTLDRPPRRLEARWGSVDEMVERGPRAVRSVLTLEVPAQSVPPDAYRDFARFCQAVDELLSRPPLLRTPGR